MKIIDVSTIHVGRAFSVEKVNVALPDGKSKYYDRINHRDSATILPVDAENHIWFVRQYRMGSENFLLELPAGVLDDGEDPLTCAQREIREEIGKAAKSWEQIGAFYLAPGYCTEMNYVFLARELYSSPLSLDEDEFLSTERHSIDAVLEMMKKDSIKDCKTMAALGAFFNK